MSGFPIGLLLAPVSNMLTGQLTGARGEGPLANLLENLEGLSQELRELVAANRAAIDALLATEQTQNVSLPRPVPILIAYWTVEVDADGRLAFRPDVYDRDPALIAALDRAP